MNKLNIVLLTCFSLFFFAACEEEVEFEKIDKKPIGGFVEQAIAVNADYFSQELEVITANMAMNRTDPEKKVTFELEMSVDTVGTGIGEELLSSFELTNKTITIYGSQDTVQDVLTVNWAGIPAGKSVNVTVTVKEGGEVDVNSGRSEIVFTLTKGKAPVVSMNQATTWKAILPYDATTNQKFKLAVLTLDKPAIQDLEVVFTLNEANVQQGTHFNIISNEGRQVIVVPAGETTGEVEIEVIGTEFGIGESAALWIEARKNANYMYTVNSGNWWSTISMGRDAMFNVFLDAGSEYDALLADSTEIIKLITVTFPNIVDRVLEEDMLIPIAINEEEAQEGTHFEMAEKAILVKKGQRNGTLTLKVLGEAFQSSEDNVQLWIELGSIPNVGYDSDNWWTTINIGLD